MTKDNVDDKTLWGNQHRADASAVPHPKQTEDHHGGPAPPRRAGPWPRRPGIGKRFGATVALHDAGITVAAGEAHALVGRNGAGKSTLVSILTGLQAPDAGTLRFAGEPAPAVGDSDAWRSRVACVYQKSTIIPDLTVAENLFLNRQSAGALRLIRWKQLRRGPRSCSAEYGVDVDADARARDLTVEQRQFVEIARALSFGARFIILDEPTAQLDARGIDRLFDGSATCSGRASPSCSSRTTCRRSTRSATRSPSSATPRHILTAPVAELGHQALVEAMTGETRRHGGRPPSRPRRRSRSPPRNCWRVDGPDPARRLRRPLA